MSAEFAMSARLQRRYQRLLAFYPPDYRREYEDEMLGVLMTGSTPQQRYPEPREAVNLLAAATRMRLGRARGGTADSRWIDAAAVLAVLAPVFLLAKYLRVLVDAGAWHLRYGFMFGPGDFSVHASVWPRIGCWAAATVAVLCGWRAAAAAFAWLGAVFEIALLITRAGDLSAIMSGTAQDLPQSAALFVAWPVVLTVIAAVLLSVPTPRRRGAALLGSRGGALIGIAALVCAMMPAAVTYLATQGPTVAEWKHLDDTLWPYFSIFPPRVALVVFTGIAVIVLVTLLALVRLEPPTRRRVLAVLFSLATMVTIIQLGLVYGFSGAVYVLPPVLSGPIQWLLLAIVPPSVLVASVLVIRWREAGQEPSNVAGVDSQPA